MSAERSSPEKDFKENLFDKMVFYLPRLGQTKRKLTAVIESNGGVVTSQKPEKGHKNIICLADETLWSSPHFKTSDCYWPSYIVDCVRMGEKLEIEAYRCSEGLRKMRRIPENLKNTRSHGKDNGAGGDEGDDSDGWAFDDPFPTKVQITGVPRGRTKYTTAEDLNIIKYLVQSKGFHRLKGNTMWDTMVSLKITQHSSQSMKSRYRDHIKKGLDEYNIPDSWKAYLTYGSPVSASEENGSASESDNNAIASEVAGNQSCDQDNGESGDDHSGDDENHGDNNEADGDDDEDDFDDFDKRLIEVSATPTANKTDKVAPVRTRSRSSKGRDVSPEHSPAKMPRLEKQITLPPNDENSEPEANSVQPQTSSNQQDLDSSDDLLALPAVRSRARTRKRGNLSPPEDNLNDSSSVRPCRTPRKGESTSASPKKGEASPQKSQSETAVSHGYSTRSVPRNARSDTTISRSSRSPQKRSDRAVPQPTRSPQKRSDRAVPQPTRSPQKRSERAVPQPTRSPQKRSDRAVPQPTRSPQKRSDRAVPQPTRSPQKGSETVVSPSTRSHQKRSDTSVPHSIKSPPKKSDETAVPHSPRSQKKSEMEVPHGVRHSPRTKTASNHNEHFVTEISSPSRGNKTDTAKQARKQSNRSEHAGNNSQDLEKEPVLSTSSSGARNVSDNSENVGKTVHGKGKQLQLSTSKQGKAKDTDKTAKDTEKDLPEKESSSHRDIDKSKSRNNVKKNMEQPMPSTSAEESSLSRSNVRQKSRSKERASSSKERAQRPEKSSVYDFEPQPSTSRQGDELRRKVPRQLSALGACRAISEEFELTLNEAKLLLWRHSGHVPSLRLWIITGRCMPGHHYWLPREDKVLKTRLPDHEDWQALETMLGLKTILNRVQWLK